MIKKRLRKLAKTTHRVRVMHSQTRDHQLNKSITIMFETVVFEL